MYALNLSEDGVILSVTYPEYAPADAVIVDTLPEGDVSQYRYVDGEFVYDPLLVPDVTPENPDGSGGGSGADLLNDSGVIKQEHLPEGYPYRKVSDTALYSGTVTISGGESVLPNSIGFELGKTYVITWNGTDYVCSSISTAIDGVGAVVGVGNQIIIGGPNTGEPFGIVDIVDDSVVSEMGFGTMVGVTDGSTSATVVVREMVMEAINKDYLPEGYPYFIPAGQVVLAETTYVANETLPITGVVLGASYSVTWDGTAYSVTAKTITLEGTEYTYLGNSRMFGGDNTGEPFLLVNMGGQTLVASLDETGTGTISIVTEESYVPMDERYIPPITPDFSSFNIASGVAEGSLRSSTAMEEDDSYSLGESALAIGEGAKASGRYSAAIGYNASAINGYAIALGWGSESSGSNSFAVSSGTASGYRAIALGGRATGSESVAFTGCEASASNAHAQGYNTYASGKYSHAEGYENRAYGEGSHVEGVGHYANGDYQHVQGKYSDPDPNDKYAHIVGNGTSLEKSNAHTLDWNGVGWFAGGLQVGGSTQDGEGAKSVLLVGDTAPNPSALTFTGAVTGSYDGSAAVNIEIPAGGGGESIPSYVRTESEAVARLVNQHQSEDSIVFPFLTDAHCGYYQDTVNAATTLAGQLLHLIGKRVPYDFIVNGGDMANGAWDTTRTLSYEQIEDYTELMSEAHRGVPSIWTPGNHDDAPYQATADRVTQKEIYTLIGRKNRLSGAVCPDGCNYGYLDLDNRNLRVIYLDTDDKRSWGTVTVGNGEDGPDYLNAHNLGAEQLQWLANSALDFSDKDDPSDWSIVVVSHVALNVTGTITDAVSGASYSHSTENAAVILSAYKGGSSGSITHNGSTVTYDFTAQTERALVICAVHGHNHKFSSETLTGSILSIGCPNVMNGRERASDDGNTYTKTAGTAEGTSFCILTIDRVNSMVYADCVGVGPDREFTFTTNAVAYTNRLPLATDTDGSIYNGVGYKADTYLSSGTVGTKTGTFTSGFIPCKVGDKLYCENITMQTGQDGHRICVYDSEKNHLTTVKTTVTAGNWFTYGDDGNIDYFTVDGSQPNAAYIRFCCGYIGSDSIVTVNEPIV